MMKQISSLESSRKIYLTRRISLNSETVEIYTFFEASSYGCQKMKCEVTKVINKQYSCDMSWMSREMTKTDDQDSSKCRKSKRRDIMGIFESLSGKGQNTEQCHLLYSKQKKKT